jgi:hypothetical protein
MLPSLNFSGCFIVRPGNLNNPNAARVDMLDVSGWFTEIIHSLAPGTIISVDCALVA